MASFRVLKLLEPDLCLECRFRKIIDASIKGKTETMVKCMRLDCDNWDYTNERRADIIANEREE